MNILGRFTLIVFFQIKRLNASDMGCETKDTPTYILMYI